MPRAQQLALMNAYGSGGPAAARAALNLLTKLNPADFISEIQKPLISAKGKNVTEYTSKMSAKQERLTKFFKFPTQTEFANNGARACTNTTL